jgi:hypothetical protein
MWRRLWLVVLLAGCSEAEHAPIQEMISAHSLSAEQRKLALWRSHESSVGGDASSPAEIRAYMSALQEADLVTRDLGMRKRTEVMGALADASLAGVQPSSLKPFLRRVINAHPEYAALAVDRVTQMVADGMPSESAEFMVLLSLGIPAN